MLDRRKISDAVASAGLSDSSVCLHASLKAFGHVDGGADAVIDAFLDAGCTLMTPTFCGDLFAVKPERSEIPERNGWDYIAAERLPARTEQIYSHLVNDICRDMGAIPSALLNRPDRVRGNHPVDSFSAVGPLASSLIEKQSWNDVYGPLRELARLDGYVVLAGVGLNRMTILHLAEALAGRRLFRTWASRADGSAVAVPTGGCSEGFSRLDPMIGILATSIAVGESKWRIFPAAETLTSAAAIIRVNPKITHCGDPECLRCPDAIAGGPVI